MSDDLAAAKRLAANAGMPVVKAQALELGLYMGFFIAHRPQSSDQGVLGHSFENDIFLSGVPEYVPHASHTVLDIGAHLGDFSLLLSRRVAKVYAIEARKETFALLRTNIALNAVTNIIADHAALTGENGFIELFHAPDGESWGDSTTHNYEGSSEIVPALTLDRYFYERNIARVNFAKFNCEGAEFPVLMSADAATLSKIDMMLVLYHCDFMKGASETMLADKLAQSGFTISIRNRQEDRGWIIAERSVRAG